MPTNATLLLSQWVQTNGLGGGFIVQSLAVCPNGTGGTNLFAGTAGAGVFLSTDNGTSWTAFSTGLPIMTVRTLAANDTYVFAGTFGGGVWRRRLSEIATSVELLFTNLAVSFCLSQNFPNPFNPATTIAFAIPSESFVTLKIFDAMGRETAAHISRELSPAATHSDGMQRVFPAGFISAVCRLEQSARTMSGPVLSSRAVHFSKQGNCFFLSDEQLKENGLASWRDPRRQESTTLFVK